MLIDMEVTPNTKYFTDHEDDKMTKTSIFVRVLIKICFIPVTVKNDQIVFKILSCKTFVFFACSIIWSILVNMTSQILIGPDKFDQYFNEVNVKNRCLVYFSTAT